MDWKTLRIMIQMPLIQLVDVPATFADVTRLIEDFGYKPNTSFTEGIARFIKWYKSFYVFNDPLKK